MELGLSSIQTTHTNVDSTEDTDADDIDVDTSEGGAEDGDTAAPALTTFTTGPELEEGFIPAPTALI